MANENGFGAPSEIFVDGRKITQEEYAVRIAANDSLRIDFKRVIFTRINGVVKMYVATV